MSRIGKLAADIESRGREKRETWQPKAGGAPLRSYLWWRDETGHHRAQENFCHFWRVVLIWSPLLRLRRLVTFGKLQKIDSGDLFLAFMLLVTALGVIAMVVGLAGALWPAIGAWAVLASPAMIAGTAGAGVGFICGASATSDKVQAYRRQKQENKPRVVVGASAKSADVHPQKKPVVWPAIKSALLKVGRPFGRVAVACWEYAVLVAQVVRVKKWKICPIVEIPSSS